MSVMMIPAAAFRAFVHVAGRHLARRACRYLRTIDARELDALAREAREFARLMQGFRACAHRFWRPVRHARLGDARR